MLISPFKIISSLDKSLNLCSSVRKTAKFKLIEKTDKLPVEKDQLKILSFLPEKAESYSSVTIGKADDINYKKTIMTFYSSDGDIIRKVFNCSDGEIVIRDYTQREELLKGDIAAKIRKIITKTFDNNTYNYNIERVEEQKAAKSPNKDIKLQINKNIIKDAYIDASVTEYTKNANKKFNKKDNKVLSLKILLSQGMPKISDVFVKNIKFSPEDKYLPFRMIFEDNLKRFSFAKFILKEKGLDSLNVMIKFSNNLRKGVAAYFSEFENSLVFNTFSTENPIKLVAHEVQHAYQYSQIGRIGKGKSKYCIQSRAIKGDITDPKERSLALNYYVASEKYPSLDGNSSISNNPDYFNNLLEFDANNEAIRVYADYQKCGQNIGRQLFFGDF